ncbi:MAG: VTT domain-containing protein [Bacteroidota bacterium]
MSILTELFHNLTDPVWIMAHGGLYIVLLIVFAETGLFAGFFLPGDSLLFITGIIIANTAPAEGSQLLSLLYWGGLIAIAGVAGNYLGYWFGKRAGSILLKRKDSWLFKKKYIVQASKFYERKGPAAIVFARFLPIVRTFAPIVAGMVKMDIRKFTVYNILGSFLWVGSIASAGFLLGENEWVKTNLELIILCIVAVTTIPVIVKLISRDKSLTGSTQGIEKHKPHYLTSKTSNYE